MFFEKLSKALVLPFILLVVSPLTFYFVNINEYLIAPVDVVKYLVLAFLLVGILLFLVLLVFRKKYLFASAAMIALAAIIWLQGQILVWDFGPLDGRGVDWQRWSVHSYLEIALWVIGFFGLIALLAKNRKLQVNMCKLLFVLGAFSIGNGFFTAPERKIVEVASVDESGLAAVSFHPESNNILIVLDTFQSNAFSEIMEKYPGEVEFLTGFTFYPNTVGGYPTTQPSIPMMLSGEVTKNETPIREWTYKVNKNSKYLNNLLGDKYFVSMAPNTLDGSNGLVIPLHSFIESFLSEELLNFISVLDGGFFKSLPSILKKPYYSEGNWFLSTIFTKVAPSPDFGFFNYFERHASVIDTNASDNPQFRFYHLAGPHWPLQIDENFELREDMAETWDSYIRQTRGVLTQLNRAFSKLKDLGVYNNSNIIVVGDHGTMPFKGNDFIGSGDWSAVPDRVLASSRPLYLVKKSGAFIEKLDISSDAKHLKNVMCEFFYDRFCLDDTSERAYYFYNWGDDYWDKSHLPSITEYIVIGDVRELASWSRGDSYTEKGRVNLSNALRPGQVLKINSMELKETSVFLFSGWSHTEASGTWTNDKIAKIRLNVQECHGTACVLRVYAYAFLPKNKHEQIVDVYINDELLDSVAMNYARWHEVVIPSGVVKEDGDIRLQFEISEPTSPCDVSNSKDCRKLGMHLGELSVNYLELISPGNPILFSAGDTSNSFVKKGWYSQESAHRWTDGAKATLQLQLDQSKLNPNKSLLLRLQANGFAPKGKDHQPVTVMVNDTEVAQWQLRGVEWHEAIIPAEVAAKQWPLQVDFLIAEPTAPCEVSESTDCRKLGMAARELVLEAVESGQ